MNKNKTIQNITIIVLAVALIVMSVGYAAYTQTLTINGTATVKAAKWSVHFDNIAANTADTSTAGVTVDTAPVYKDANTKQEVDFAVTMDVNTKYSFYVDVVNDGTFDATLDSLALNVKKAVAGTDGTYPTATADTQGEVNGATYVNDTTTSDVTDENGITSTLKNDYLKYDVEYTSEFDTKDLAAGTISYPTTFNAITAKDDLSHAKSRRAKVTVEYYQPENYNALPQANTKYEFELKLNYVQKNAPTTNTGA